jgi:hypothetical protein
MTGNRRNRWRTSPGAGDGYVATIYESVNYVRAWLGRREDFRANGAGRPLNRGADLATSSPVRVGSRFRARLRRICAVWLVTLSASPFTAPFRTCEMSLLFDGGTLAPSGPLPASPARTMATDASLQPSSLAVRTARVRVPVLVAAAERSLLGDPFARGLALLPALPAPSSRPAGASVLRI